MRTGRPGKGVEHVDKLDASEHAKERLRVILEVTSGDLTRKEGAALLGLSERTYRELRDRAFGGALESLEPRPTGRPRKHSLSNAEQRVQVLQDELEALQLELKTAQVREEIALVFPELVVRGKARAHPRRRAATKRRTSNGSKRG